jgi:hypothetical protein
VLSKPCRNTGRAAPFGCRAGVAGAMPLPSGPKGAKALGLGRRGTKAPRLGYKGHEGSLAVVAGAEPPDGYTGVKPCFKEGNPKREGESSLPFGKQATR